MLIEYFAQVNVKKSRRKGQRSKIGRLFTNKTHINEIDDNFMIME